MGKIVEALNKKGIKPYFADRGFVLYLGDSLKILGEIPQESFDMIFSRGAMPLYLHDPEQIKEAFDEVIRVLKKGGTAYVSPIEHTKIIENNPAKTMTETHEKMGPFITKRLIEKALHDRNGIEYEFVNKKMKMSDFAVDLYATPESAFLILKKK